MMPPVLGDAVIASAILERLLHHSHEADHPWRELPPPPSPPL